MKTIARWPITGYRSNSFKTDPNYIEEYFNEFYFPYKCLYVTRCRVAIDLIIQLEGLNRLSEIFIQPHSPHCLIDAIGRQTVPNSVFEKQSSADIIYHQYGHRTTVNNNKRKKVLIEDSADSLILSSKEEELFPNNGRYCIFSLSKIIGADWGAIIICNNTNDYYILKKNLKFSAKINKKLFSWAYENRSFFERKNGTKLPHSYFSVNEYKFPHYNVPIIGELDKVINTTKIKIKENIEIIHEKLKREVYTNKKRMPSNLVFKVSDKIYNRISLKDGIIINEKQRIYYDYDTGKEEIVNLIPVHIGAEKIC